LIVLGLCSAALIWAAGVLALSCRLAGGWLLLRRWRRGSESLPDALAPTVRRIAEALGLGRDIAVRTSVICAQPIAFGLLRPVILLPIAFITELPPHLLEAMIAHEIAHIRRHDLWVNLLQRVVEVLLFYHPAVWWVSGRMRLERELCCDDLA